MTTAPTALMVWIIILLVAIPYVRAIKHEKQKLLAAYLIFITVLSAVAFGLYLILIPLLLQVIGPDAQLGSLGYALLLAACTLPAAWVATMIARKPPLRSPRI